MEYFHWFSLCEFVQWVKNVQHTKANIINKHLRFEQNRCSDAHTHTFTYIVTVTGLRVTAKTFSEWLLSSVGENGSSESRRGRRNEFYSTLHKPISFRSDLILQSENTGKMAQWSKPIFRLRLPHQILQYYMNISNEESPSNTNPPPPPSFFYTRTIPLSSRIEGKQYHKWMKHTDAVKIILKHFTLYSYWHLLPRILYIHAIFIFRQRQHWLKLDTGDNNNNDEQHDQGR